jgi:hypothetical protein
MHDSTRIETSWSILLLGVFVGFSLFAAKAFSPLPLAFNGGLCVSRKRGVGNQIPAAKIACTGNSRAAKSIRTKVRTVGGLKRNVFEIFYLSFSFLGPYTERIDL